MTKPKEKNKEKISVASEIDRIEGRKSLCQDSLEKAEFRQRRENLSDEERSPAVPSAEREQEEHAAVRGPACHQCPLILCPYQLLVCTSPVLISPTPSPACAHFSCALTS
ncbi:hypothetical protein JZ751_004813 [Albula glossodonta]|uniref:Uncharacterized protein n=1 Tax=Albula glossodonta TaxID=121402 RepID=A0A8T2P6F4_9TELE|nr:hypothetical protein JZ751_004813 [Albula glossodonta]